MMRRIILALIFLATLSPITEAQTYDRAKLWEAEINNFADIDQKQTPPENAVLFVGSSSIRGWRTLREDFPQMKIINRGFGGSRFEDVNFFIPQTVTPYKPKMIVAYAGENDIAAGQTAENVFEDFKTFISTVRKIYPRTPIVYIAIKPSPSRWQMWAEMQKANNLIKQEIAKLKSIKFVDFSSQMLAADGRPKPEIYQGDNLHLNRQGYEIWRALLLPHLK